MIRSSMPIGSAAERGHFKTEFLEIVKQLDRAGVAEPFIGVGNDAADVPYSIPCSP